MKNLFATTTAITLLLLHQLIFLSTSTQATNEGHSRHKNTPKFQFSPRPYPLADPQWKKKTMLDSLYGGEFMFFPEGCMEAYYRRTQRIQASQPFPFYALWNKDMMMDKYKNEKGAMDVWKKVMEDIKDPKTGQPDPFAQMHLALFGLFEQSNYTTLRHWTMNENDRAFDPKMSWIGYNVYTPYPDFNPVYGMLYSIFLLSDSIPLNVPNTQTMIEKTICKSDYDDA
jgi:hypothetical protein